MMRQEIMLFKTLSEWKVCPATTLDEQLSNFMDLLKTWNRKYNLTKIESDQGIYYEHFYDSVIVFKFFPLNGDERLLDLGTGGGFPGIPIKLVRPQLDMVLLDSSFKKIWFLRKVIRGLNLHEISLCHARAEEIGHEMSHREGYEVVTTRALSSLAVLVELAFPLMTIKGKLIAWKTADQLEREVKESEKALNELGGEVLAVHYYQLPKLEKDRALVICQKNYPSPEKYPRKPGKPEKYPLI